MGQKGHVINQKGLEMHEKRAKNRVFKPKIAALTENHPAQKPFAERGGTPPPLTGKIR